jgi:succinyl-CoA synthetase beta subunit
LLLRKLRLYPLLGGFRSQPKADIPALVSALVALSRLADDFGPRLIELEINPFIVFSEGHGAVAVDGRATLAPAATVQAPAGAGEHGQISESHPDHPSLPEENSHE